LYGHKLNVNDDYCGNDNVGLEEQEAAAESITLFVIASTRLS
jgi:hypothetical protein